MPQITEDEHLLFQKLKHIILHSNPDKFEGCYFICGSSETVDEHGLPEYLSVCPALGLDFSKLYKKVTLEK